MSRAHAVAFAACLAAPSAFAASLARVPAIGSIGVPMAPAALAVSAPAPLAATLLPTTMAIPLAALPALPAPAVSMGAAPVAAANAMAAAAPAVAAPALKPAPRAAADGKEGPEFKAPADQPKTEEGESAASGKLFDGAKPEALAPVAAPAAAPEPAPAAKPKRVRRELGAGLKAADPADEEWLAAVVKTLGTTKTGRRILSDIAELREKRGNPTIVVVKAIGNNGEFRYDSDLLVMDATHRRRDPEQTAPIMAHELQHVLQRALDLPVDALELEIESYTEESKVWTELGIEPKSQSFARQARGKLRTDPDAFFTWLNEQYKNNHALHGGSMAGYVKWLEDKKPALAKRVRKAEKDLERAKRVLESMRAEGKSEAAILSFLQDDVEPVERRLRNLAVEKAWGERDLGLLSTPEGRARFRSYSRGVIRRARALSRS